MKHRGPGSAVLMSIRPQYAEAILDGRKTVELRRQRPRIPTGTDVLIYASSPTRLVCGAFTCGGLVGAAPIDLWQRLADRACISRDDFDRYFEACDTGYALDIANARHVRPTALPIRPPQSYQWLRDEDHRHVDLLALVRPSPDPGR